MIAVIVALLSGCHAVARRSAPSAAPQGASRFFDLAETDPMAAAPLARAVLRSPLTDTTTRGRVLEVWSRIVGPLEALRDARLADAEALLAQGAVAAAAEAVHEAAELETAVGMPGAPRSASQLAREVEWARGAAERTAREAGERARGARRIGDWSTAATAAAEARQLRNRAGLVADIDLAVIEGLSRRAVPEPVTPPLPSVALESPTQGKTLQRPPPRRRADAPAPPAPRLQAAAEVDPLANVRYASRSGDLPGAWSALEDLRARGVAGPGFTALSVRLAAERESAIRSSLAAAESAYEKEDLETARAYWQRVLELAPENARAAEGLTLYRRFLALQGR